VWRVLDQFLDARLEPPPADLTDLQSVAPQDAADAELDIEQLALEELASNKQPYKRLSRTASLSSTGSGHSTPDAAKRRIVSRTVDGATPSRRATSRTGTFASRISLNISRTRRMLNLSVGIGPPQKGRSSTTRTELPNTAIAGGIIPE
jgi:hypothetical protein